MGRNADILCEKNLLLGKVFDVYIVEFVVPVLVLTIVAGLLDRALPSVVGVVNIELSIDDVGKVLEFKAFVVLEPKLWFVPNGEAVVVIHVELFKSFVNSYYSNILGIIED